MDNKDSTKPTLCTAGCGFYGNELFNNMCSKCYKLKKTSTDKHDKITSRKHHRTPSPEPISTPLIPSSPVSKEVLSDKPKQTNKGRCFKCRVKIPLAKQAANKCRCTYVFCDSHRYPDRHDCDIDYIKMDREILAKNNPKLHERPKGGRSFQRIDSL